MMKMKKIKRIVSAVASIVLGFSIITTSQVFAAYKSKPITYVYLNSGNSYVATVPNDYSATNMQGMATDGQYLYIARFKDNKSAVIYRYDKNKNRQFLKNGKSNYISLGHANDMTAVKYGKTTYLFVLDHDANSPITKIHHLEVKNNTYEEIGTYEVDGGFHGIAANVEGNNSAQSTCEFYLKTASGGLYKCKIKLNSKEIECWDKNGKQKTRKICNLPFEIAGSTAQGIAYDRGILYMAFSETNAQKRGYGNTIIEYNLNNKDVVARDVTITNDSISKTGYFEIESCTIFDNKLYFNTNSDTSKTGKKYVNYDGIYKINK